MTHYLLPHRKEPRAPRVAEDHGELAVVTWASERAEEALVGALPASELLVLVRLNQVE